MAITSSCPSKTVYTARVIGWGAASLSVGIALGWIGSQAAAVLAPLFIFSLLFGLVLGAILVVLMRVCQVHSVGIVYPVAILAVVLMVASQHWFAYREVVQTIHEEIRSLQKAANQFPDKFQGQISAPPQSLIAFMSDEASRPRHISTWFGKVTLQGSRAWTFWGLDALMVLLPTFFLLWRGRARPWCATCCSWYRTTRTGRLDRATGESLLAMLTDEESNQDTPGGCNQDDKYASFVMRDCDGRCGETELRILFTSTSTIETYRLDRAKRQAVESILDGDSYHSA